MRSWRKAAVTGRSRQDRDFRLAFLLWRIWFLKTKRDTVQSEEERNLLAAAGSAATPEGDADADEEEAETGGPSTSPQQQIESPRRAAATPPKRYSSADALLALRTGRRRSTAADDSDSQAPVSPRARRLSAGGPADGPTGESTAAATKGGSAVAGGADGAAEAREEEAQHGPLYYIVMVSSHGLIRSQEIELGRDSDTGGQTKYVVELARALGRQPEVAQVDLVTRRITDPAVSPAYGVRLEPIEETQQSGGPAAAPGGGGNSEPRTPVLAEGPPKGAAPAAPRARIVRLEAGNPNIYLRKELLWPHVRAATDPCAAAAWLLLPTGVGPAASAPSLGRAPARRGGAGA